MKYGKLRNGALEYAPRKIVDGNTVTYNPTAETVMALGYIPVTYTEPPEVEEGYYATYHWEEQSGEIIQVWEVVEDDGTPEELIGMLEEAL